MNSEAMIVDYMAASRHSPLERSGVEMAEHGDTMSEIELEADSVRAIPFLATMPKEWALHFQKWAQEKRYLRHSLLALRDVAVDRLHIFLEGGVKLFRESEAGEESFVDLLAAGDTLGETLIFSNARYPYSAEVIKDTRVLEIPVHIIRAAMLKDGALSLKILEYICHAQDRKLQQSEQLMLMSASQRIGCYLLRLVRRFGGDGDFSFPVSKNLIASHLHMKPETFSRKKKLLKEIGVTFKGAHVHIADIQQLQEFCCRNCPVVTEDCERHRISNKCSPKALIS